MLRILTAHLFALLAAAFFISPVYAAKSNESSTSSTSGKRVALVIGNGAYQSKELPKLENPTNDAEDVASALKAFGFEVLSHKNLGRRAMKDAIADFGRRSGNADVALLYYAGHGVQIKNQNFLIPVDLAIRSEADVMDEAININLPLDEMEIAKSRINIVILDACRDNPISGKFRSTGGRGLAAPSGNVPKGTVIVYATDPGNTALDGEGRNGTFTAGLLNALKGKDLSLDGVLTTTSEYVEKASKGTQTPYVNGPQLVKKNFHFAVTVNPGNQEIEKVFWESIKDSQNTADFEAYLKKYPQGDFKVLAENRLRALKNTTTPVALASRPSQVNNNSVPKELPQSIQQAKSTSASIPSNSIAITSTPEKSLEARGQMVVYSAGVNQLPLDALGRDDRNQLSLFAREFLPTISSSDSVVASIRRVRAAVREKAGSLGHAQDPAFYDQSTGDISFLNKGKRVALVVGNADYKYFPKIAKSINDSLAVANEFKRIGFDVMHYTNLNMRELNRAVNDLTQMANGGLAVLYYSGYGMQIENQNHLLPIDLERTQNGLDMADQSVSVPRIQDKLAAAARFSVLVLDAGQRMQTPSATTVSSLTQPAPSNATGQIVIYATSSNQEALDALSPSDRDPNPLFTRHFLKEAFQPGINVIDAAKQTMRMVSQSAMSVRHSQTPTIIDQSQGNFFLRSTGIAPPEKRVAMVIGNDQYLSLPKLEKDVSGANSFANELRKSGFEVSVRNNSGQRDMNQAINDFMTNVRDGGIGIFYYAGHGVEINGNIYLIPTDTVPPKDEADIRDQAIHISRILDKLQLTKAKFSLLVFDICRNNPLPKKAIQ